MDFEKFATNIKIRAPWVIRDVNGIDVPEGFKPQKILLIVRE